MTENVTCLPKFRLGVSKENKITQIYEGIYQTKSEGPKIGDYIKRIEYQYWDKYGKGEDLNIYFSNGLIAFIRKSSDQIFLSSNKDKGDVLSFNSTSEFKSKAWEKTDQTVRETFLKALSLEARSLLEKALEE